MHSLEAVSYFPVIGDPASLALAIMYAAKGDFDNAGLNLAAAGVGIFVAGEGKLIIKGGVLTAEEAGKLLAGNKNDTYHTITLTGYTKDGGYVETTIEHVPANGEKGLISPENEKYVDILSPEAKQHILYGDNLTSGGHLYPGNPGKTVFP